jgi:hypothetical protein
MVLAPLGTGACLVFTTRFVVCFIGNGTGESSSGMALLVNEGPPHSLRGCATITTSPAR